MAQGDVVSIVLTGGPCAGKSTLLEMLGELDTIVGRKPFFVAEAATILINAGRDVFDVVPFQRAVLELQLQLEGEAMARAQAFGAPSVIICDRGTLDGSAYCSEAEFASIVAACGQTVEGLLARYDAIVHLSSASVDVPHAYTTDNNGARFEDLEGAIVQERKTLAAWARHPRRVTIGGQHSFEAKMNEAVAAIEEQLRQLG